MYPETTIRELVANALIHQDLSITGAAPVFELYDDRIEITNPGVVLPAFVVDALAKTAKGKGRHELMWPARNGGYLAPPSMRDSWLAGAVCRCQESDPEFPRVTAHGLRHTAASLAISAGANPKVVQRMLGHASAAMTLDVYADLFESDLDTVAESVAKMWPREA